MCCIMLRDVCSIPAHVQNTSFASIWGAVARVKGDMEAQPCTGIWADVPSKDAVVS